jgi:predicted nucleic acid-binding protein
VIVVDASATVALLLDQGPQADAIRVRLADEDLHGPHILDLGVANAVRSLALRRRIESTRATAVLEHLALLPVRRYPHTPLLRRIWELRDNVTPYDAAYIALAESLGAPLITIDGRLSRAPGHQALVEVL